MGPILQLASLSSLLGAAFPGWGHLLLVSLSSLCSLLSVPLLIHAKDQNDHGELKKALFPRGRGAVSLAGVKPSTDLVTLKQAPSALASRCGGVWG